VGGGGPDWFCWEDRDSSQERARGSCLRRKRRFSPNLLWEKRQGRRESTSDYLKNARSATILGKKGAEREKTKGGEKGKRKRFLSGKETIEEETCSPHERGGRTCQRSARVG